MTSPLTTEPANHPSSINGSAVTAEPFAEAGDRLKHLEDEITELRDTVARFAELVLGEVKDLRQSKSEPLPANELPASHSAAAPGAAVLEPPAPARRPWLLTETLRDFGTTIRMYLDPRYRVRRSTQIMVPVLFCLFALNCFFFREVFLVPVLRSVLEKIGDIILAILLYKVVTREIVRYRQVLAQLMAWHDYRDRTAVIVVGDPPMTRLETH
jgi:hypothetical protein